MSVCDAVIPSGQDFEIASTDLDSFPRPVKRRRLASNLQPSGSSSEGEWDWLRGVLNDLRCLHSDLIHATDLRQRDYLVDALASVFQRADGELRTLQDHHAGSVMDFVKDWLSAATSTHPFWRRALYLLVKLSSRSRRFPTSLFLQGVDIGSSRDPLCHGGFADVFCGTYQGRAVAVKRLRLDKSSSDIHQTVYREALVWEHLKHPRILPFIGIDRETFRSTGYICLVAPWMQRGNLRQYRTTPGNYSPKRDLRRILCEVAEGLVYLHSLHIVHGDITEENILIDDEGHVRLADFGLVKVGESTEGRMSATQSGAGTTRWMSPQRFLNAGRVKADDVYAFGCLAFTLYTLKSPHHNLRTSASVILAVVAGTPVARPAPHNCVVELTNRMWTLITSCLEYDQDQRPLIAEVLVFLQIEESVDGNLTPRTVLRAAIELSRLDDIRTLAVHGSLASTPSIDGDTRTHLHRAAALGLHDVVEVLMELGACPTVTDRLGNTPIHWATHYGHTRMARSLLLGFIRASRAPSHLGPKSSAEQMAADGHADVDLLLDNCGPVPSLEEFRSWLILRTKNSEQSIDGLGRGRSHQVIVIDLDEQCRDPEREISYTEFLSSPPS